MPKTTEQGNPQVPAAAEPPVSPTAIGEGLFSPNAGADGKMHVGISIDLATDGHPASLLIDNPGAEKGKDEGGGASMCLTRPLNIKFENLEAYLAEKVTLSAELRRLLVATELDCNALYYRDGGPSLVNIGLKSADKTGLIESLSGSKDLGKLFDITGVSLRILNCPKACQTELEDYWKTVSALPSATPEEKASGDVSPPAESSAKDGEGKDAGPAEAPAAT